MPRFNILSIDGGGIRGIIPAMILARIERRTGRRITEMFDLIAGTSTGAILALGLTVPQNRKGTRPKYGANQLVSFYEEDGRKVFHAFWQNIVSLHGLIDMPSRCLVRPLRTSRAALGRASVPSRSDRAPAPPLGPRALTT